MARIPFENLDVLLGRPIRLDTESLQTKLIEGRRGGYCFEHASLLATVLEQLGFHPKRHAARVTLVRPREESPRGHMFLTVRLREGTFVVDPGFGSLAPQLPVPLREAVVVRSGNEEHWMHREGRYWILRARTEGKELDCWVSTLEPENAIDFEMANHYISTHPASPFVNRLLMRALTADGRVGVMNREVSVWRNGVLHTEGLANRAALRQLLARDFGIDLPDVEQIRVPAIPEWT
jgi:N-hydroxyarylamine O-acetyltransferase